MTFSVAEWVPPSSDVPDRAQPAQLEPRVRALAEQEFSFIWRLLRRMGLSKEDADDAAQEVFLVGLRRFPSIIPGSERSFLIGTALRVVGTERRRFARCQRAMARFSPPSDPNPTPEYLVERRSDLGALDDVLERMPLDLRSVFVLFELEEVPEPEIAKALDIPRGTVASRLRRARKIFHDGVRRQRTRLRAREGAS